MIKEFEHKKQGDGSDSWTVTEWEDEAKTILHKKYMVYIDPKKPAPFTPEEIAYLKQELGL